MADLSSYQIAYDGFTGSIDLFFTFVKNKKDILKTLSLSNIIEGFIVFTDEIEIQIEELIKFYDFANSLFYLKSQMIFPLKLSPKKRDEKIVEKLIILGDQYEELKKTNEDNNIIDSEIDLVKDFMLSDNESNENLDLNFSQENTIKNKEKKTKKESLSKMIKEEIEEIPVNLDDYEIKMTNKRYKTRILEKKMKIVNILRKENSLSLKDLLDINKEYYFFERFCYFLISLEYKMSDIIDLFYNNKNLILRKGRNINRYGQ